MVLIAPGTGFQVKPPSLLTCHWTVGVGAPLAAAVNVASFPTTTVRSVG